MNRKHLMTLLAFALIVFFEWVLLVKGHIHCSDYPVLGFLYVVCLLISSLIFIFACILVLFNCDSKGLTAKMIERWQPDFVMLNRNGDSRSDVCELEMQTFRPCPAYHNEGMFSGWIEHGDSATVYNSYGLVLGHLSGPDSSALRKWAGRGAVPYVGYFYQQNHVLHGKLRAVLPCNEAFLREELCRAYRWVNAALGDEYNLPSAISWVMPDE